MARLIPDYIHSDCKSNAEKKLFERFRDELPEKYVVLHSLGLAKHATKRRAEIDFLIICRSGVLCIEVKGGRISCYKGVWRFTDRYGEVHAKHESPFLQVDSAMFALQRAVENRFGKKSPQRNAVYGSAVFFPDITFKITNPDCDPERLVDERTVHQSLEKIIDRLLEYSRKEFERLSARKCLVDMTNSETEALIRYLRGDFDLVPSLSCQVEECHRKLLQLTEQQYDILDGLKKNPRVIIEGAAGTGKTLIAREAALRAAREGKKVLFVCYNRLLAQSIRGQISEMGDGQQIEVRTLHGFMKDRIIQAGLGSKTLENPDQDTFLTLYPELFEEATVSIGIEPNYDLLVVDEGQDLRYKPYIRVLDWILKGGLKDGSWFWFEDRQQDIFMNSKSEGGLIEGYPHAVYTLSKNCRNTLPISLFTSMITVTPKQKCLVNDGLVVEPVYYRSAKHQLGKLEKIIGTLLGGNVHPEDIVILSPLVKEKSIISGLDRLAGVPLKDYTPGTSSGKALRHSTIHAFKGLDSKVVIVTDIDDLESRNSRLLHYVAFSRAIAALYVLMAEQTRDQFNRLVVNSATL